MIDKQIDDYINGYLKFLKDHSFEEKINDSIVKISFPFLDSLNDCTEIYVIKDGEDYIITDNGETLSNLKFNGVNPNTSEARQGIFNRIINSYGISMDQECLLIKANYSNLFLKKHLLLQCISKINDMYVLSRANIQNIFVEDVRGFFDKNNILYVPNHRLTGRSGLTANYDFAIPKTSNRPMCLIKTMNTLTKDKVKAAVFDWNDRINGEGEKLIVLYNDEESKPKMETVQALEKYGLEHIAWSNKDKLLKELRVA